MFSRSTALHRHRLFYPVRQNIPFQFNPIKSIFPLIYENNLLAKPRNNWSDYQGRTAFNEEYHPSPVLGNRLSEKTLTHKWSHWDQFINPQLTQNILNLQPSEEYVGPRSGHNMIKMGWMKIGGSWKYARSYNDARKGFAKGQWQERKMTPRFMLAPRVSAGGPRNRYEGKATFSRISLAKIMWAIDTGRLNPNETITLFHLRQANVISDKEILWPGFVLLAGAVESIPYPLNIELQNASARAIKLVEEAGGSFTCVYMTHEGLYQELHPEEFPVFMEQELPEHKGLENFATNPRKRGWLSQWYEDEAKYANPEAGRRLSHYVKPPTTRDFPATLEEYELVKHHQKWHLNQPGTGTVLPWHSYGTSDVLKTSSGHLMSTRVELRKASVVGANPDKFDKPISLCIVLEIFEVVPKNSIDIKFVWSPIWDFDVDQVLDELEVGPFTTLGKHEFVIESDPPNLEKIPDPTGPTALLVSFTYGGEEFLHLGFNVGVTCDGEIPDVFESAEPLTRNLGRCYSTVKTIGWDGVGLDPCPSQNEKEVKKFKPDETEKSPVCEKSPLNES